VCVCGGGQRNGSYEGGGCNCKINDRDEGGVLGSTAVDTHRHLREGGEGGVGEEGS
jgi:hypothetical protein